MKPQKTTLSFSKLTGLFSEHGYTLATVYASSSGEIYFLEVRTPKIQKTFVISIPSKYSMFVTPETEHYRTVVISKLPGVEIETQQMEYMAELKGPLLQCDLFSISSSLLCLCKNNGNFELYKFGEQEDAEEENKDDSVNNLVDPVEKIVNTAAKLSRKMGVPVSDGEDHDDEKPEDPVDAENKDELILEEEPEVEAGETEGATAPAVTEGEVVVELEFVDENGKPYDGKVESLMEEEAAIPKVAREAESVIKAIDEKNVTPVSSPKEIRRRDNSIPENMEDRDITLGIIYYSLEIGLYNKKVSVKPAAVAKDPKKQNESKISSLEDEIMTAYDTIDGNEVDLRNIKLDEIVEMSAKLAVVAKEKIEKCKEEEDSLKTQILKLSKVLEQCEKLRETINNKPEKHTDNKTDIDRLYNQTKTTLYEINVEILRVKDRINETLSQYQTSLEELLSY